VPCSRDRFWPDTTRFASVIPNSRVLALLIGAVVLILLTGCAEHAKTGSRRNAGQDPMRQEVSRPTRRPNATHLMPTVARGLVPPAARGSVRSSDLAVHDCGISPTYPCIDTFFSLGTAVSKREPLAVLRAQAEKSGWRIVRTRAFGTGIALELERGSFHARYAVTRGLGPGSGIVGLDLYGPANVPARPSSEEQSRWSNEKRRYLAQADAICAKTLGRIMRAADAPPAVTEAAHELRALRAPSGEAQRVKTFLRPLDTLAQAVHALATAKGEDALAPAVALGTYAARFDRASARYGLTRCTLH
jgi:hypothetical protein